jgi:hypothetical protein
VAMPRMAAMETTTDNDDKWRLIRNRLSDNVKRRKQIAVPWLEMVLTAPSRPVRQVNDDAVARGGGSAATAIPSRPSGYRRAMPPGGGAAPLS